MADKPMSAAEWLLHHNLDGKPSVLTAFAKYHHGVMSRGLVDILEKISIGGCIVDGDGTNSNCCAYCAAAAAIRAHRAAQGTRKEE